MIPVDKLEAALHHTNQIHRDDYVVCVVISPEPPITETADSFLDDIRVIGPVSLVTTSAREAATAKYGDSWVVASCEVFEEGLVYCLSTPPQPLPVPAFDLEDSDL